MVSTLGATIEGERIAFIDNQGHETGSTGEGDRLRERIIYQRAHLSYVANTANTCGQLQQESLRVQQASEGIGGSLSRGGLAGSNVPMENNQGIAISQRGNEALASPMVIRRPSGHAGDIRKKAHLATHTLKAPVETDEARSPRLQFIVGERDL